MPGLGGICSRGSAPGESAPGGVPAPRGVPAKRGACWRPPHWTATAAGRTHPTGMHFVIILIT